MSRHKYDSALIAMPKCPVSSYAVVFLPFAKQFLKASEFHELALLMDFLRLLYKIFRTLLIVSVESNGAIHFREHNHPSYFVFNFRTAWYVGLMAALKILSEIYVERMSTSCFYQIPKRKAPSTFQWETFLANRRQIGGNGILSQKLKP